jgi:hypothetical protein
MSSNGIVDLIGTKTKLNTVLAQALALLSISSSPAQSRCDETFLKANAIFIRATVHCQKNYMDTPAGYYALAMSRQCTGLGESRIRVISKNAMLALDQIAKHRGANAACAWVDNLEAAIVKDVTR